MADVVTRKVRSRMMAGIRGKNTKPELIVRSELHKRGFRFRLHERKLPGCPDIMLPKWKTAIFVHGCFWHRHDCRLFRWPSTRAAWWKKKLQRNEFLDQQHERQLNALGWRVLKVYECSMKGPHRLGDEALINQIERWIFSKKPSGEIRGYA